MCGRYDNLLPRDVYPTLWRVMRMPQWNFPPRWNTAPTDTVPVVRIDPRDDVRELALARWGLVPGWMRDMPKVPHINARAETIHSQSLFREAFAARRCLVPATGFYEWQKRTDGRQPWRFARLDRAPFALAGLWEFARPGGKDLVSTTIVTTQPNPLVAAIHDRMPVMLLPDDWDRWLDPAATAVDLRALLKPYPPHLMCGYRVSKVVNNVKNDVPECIEPLAETNGLLL